MKASQPHSKSQRGGANKRRSQRILLQVSVIVNGKDRSEDSYEEKTRTLVVSAHGALLILQADVKENQRLTIKNRFTNQQQECRIANIRLLDDGTREVGVEFLIPSPNFWPVDFPPEDWDVTNMTAALLKEFGEPLIVMESAKPVPGPDEVLIRVEACGVCHSDLHMAYGDWPDVKARMTLPAILGHEAVGRVVVSGSEARSLRSGQRVGVGWLHSTCGTCDMCREGAENLCRKRTVTGIAAPGGFAEYMRIKASHAVSVPDGVSSEHAAPLFCAGLTVYHACKQAAIQSGQRVAVFGVGGLGHLAVQLASAAGAEVSAVDNTEDKLELARRCGARHTVLSQAPYVVELLREDGGQHVAIVTAPVKAAYDLAFKTLRRRGTIMVVGLPKEDLTFFADDMVITEARVIGSAVGTREEMREVLDLAEAGKLTCEIETFELGDINTIFERMERGELRGRAVIKM
jgi:propanol-preferring alcohol dehydrogenase